MSIGNNLQHITSISHNSFEILLTIVSFAVKIYRQQHAYKYFVNTVEW